MCYNIIKSGYKPHLNIFKCQRRSIFMLENFIQDVNMFKLFSVGAKFGIKTWYNRLVLNPICIRKPNIEELEELGYTFIVTEQGYNLINSNGQILLDEPHISSIGWFISQEVVAFSKKNETCGLFFVKSKNYIYNLTDAIEETEFIQTFRNNTTGLVTHSGKQIFEPIFCEVAIIDSYNGIYIAYNSDGTVVLNSTNWKLPTEKLKSAKANRSGIFVQYLDETYGWLNSFTGLKLEPDELTIYQHQFIKMAEKRKVP